MLLDLSIFKSVGMIWVYLNHNQSIFRWKFNVARAIDMLKDSLPLMLSGVMVDIYMKIDQVMLGNIAGNEAVGNYAAALRFSEGWYFLPMAICSYAFPAIVRAKQRSKQEYYGKLQQLYDFMAWLSFGIAVSMTLVSGSLISNLLGEDYTKAGEILALHVWAGLLFF